MTFPCLRQWYENIDCQGFEGSRCREYSKGVRPFSELHAVLRTVRTVADRFVYIGGHLRPILGFTDMSVHAGLYGVAGQYRLMSEVLHMGRSVSGSKHDLDDFGVSRMLSPQEAVVAFEEVRVEVS